MEAIKNLYLKGLDAVGDMPSFKKDWRWVLVWSLICYAVVLAFRLSFAGRWDHPELWVNGERIMATHDAYYWLAKAKGIGLLDGYPLSKGLKILHDLTGIKLGALGFWAPAIISALVAVVCYLWGWLLGGLNAGIFAGFIGGLTPGFFFRSRLGYLDSDMFTLSMTMLQAWLFAYWLACLIKSGWLKKNNNESLVVDNGLYWKAFLVGVFCRITGVWHHDIMNFIVMLFLASLVFVVINGRHTERARGLLGLAVIALAAFPGSNNDHMMLWPLTLIPVQSIGMTQIGFATILGIALSGALAIFLYKQDGKGRSWSQQIWLPAGLVAAVILSVGCLDAPLQTVVDKTSQYFFNTVKMVPDTVVQNNGPIYPSILQSVIEAKLIPLGHVLERGAFTFWIGWIALASSLVVVALRPVAILLVPLILLHLASVKMGVRFSMFGGASFMIFLGVSLCWGVRLFLDGKQYLKKAVIAVEVLASVGFTGYAYAEYAKLPLTPVIPKQHVEALIELGEQVQSDSMVWTWWDWGYATQYYGSCQTVIDGGKHAGRDVYPVAFAMATHSASKAVAMMAFSSQYPAQSHHEIGLYPARKWDTIPREQLNAYLDEQMDRIHHAPFKQYYVVTWKDLLISKWITYFGNWNLETGTTTEAKVNNFNPGELGFNSERGAIMNRQGAGGLISDVAILTRDGIDTKKYYMNTLSPQLLPDKTHLVVNKVTAQSVLMDRTAYRSMMTRLLIGDPNDPEITPYFKLVVDKLPFARIYEVVQ